MPSYCTDTYGEPLILVQYYGITLLRSLVLANGGTNLTDSISKSPLGTAKDSSTLIMRNFAGSPQPPKCSELNACKRGQGERAGSSGKIVVGFCRSTRKRIIIVDRGDLHARTLVTYTKCW
jgi:hypothetical protein